MSLTDARKMYVLLRDSGEKGMHSHELRRAGITGNPSQRAKDIVSKGVGLWTCREPQNGRPGSRYWLAEHAPDWAVPVKPNGTEGGGGLPGDSPAAPLSVEPAPEQVAVKEPVALFRDYTDPAGAWREVPVSELEAA